MYRAISALCCLIVVLQILIGVPVIVCLVFFFLTGNGGMGPVAVEMHSSPATPMPPGAVAIVPPPNAIPHALPVAADNPILASRAEHGSPLAGTVLAESVAPESDQQLFVAAFEKVTAEKAVEAPTLKAHESQASAKPSDTPDSEDATAANLREKATRFAVRHLYAMANMDERAGQYERADQWRSLARDIRRESDAEPHVP